ncbi:MAG: hypothetical protein HYY54_01595 [candidate division NC10 bacterium]|nr:hypothetical protein [candidate division NC10 bacterium]
MKVVTAKEMRELDRRATAEYGVPSLLLMENAGAAVAAEAERRFGPLRGKRIVVCCGKGNNGGDGFVAARHLHNRGAAVRVLLCAKRAEVAGDPRITLQILEKTGLPIVPVESAEDAAAAREAMAGSDVPPFGRRAPSPSPSRSGACCSTRPPPPRGKWWWPTSGCRRRSCGSPRSRWRCWSPPRWLRPSPPATRTRTRGVTATSSWWPARWGRAAPRRSAAWGCSAPGRAWSRSPSRRACTTPSRPNSWK